MLQLRDEVTLAPLLMEHAARMWSWMTDPAVSEGVGLRENPSLEKSQDWIRRALTDPTVRAYAIVLGSEHVGNAILDRLDVHLQSARLSIYVGEKSARGCGVGQTALHRLTRVGFHELGLWKIWLTVHAENHRAIASYLKVGFVLEGILRDEFLLRGRRLPVVYMGLLRHDYLACDKEANP